MSSRGYAILPTDAQDIHSSSHDEELNAAFDDSNDELLVTPNGVSIPPTLQTAAITPGAYDFEREYDCPPPGSPPGPSTRAIQGNTIGNTNGLIPEFDLNGSAEPRSSWFGRVAGSILPSHYVQRLGYGRIPSGNVGGGTINDGVFANIAAKPSRPVTARDADNNVFIVPENSQALPPPSYAAASLDTVPPYYETTIHVPASANDIPGEVIIDNLPTGTLFSFLWNMLISVSFQFIGFILTFVLHTTHAAKLGSRAGFGITLIQYGLNIRNKFENSRGDGDNERARTETWSGWHAGGSNSIRDISNSTATATPEVQNTLQSTSSEWISFALMTIGWFVLLTSLLGFWRVKRWERSILAPQRAEAAPTTPQHGPAVSLRGLPGLNGTRFPFMLNQTDLARGFGFPGQTVRSFLHPESEGTGAEVATENDSNSIEQNAGIRAIRQARRERLAANETRLQNDLRAAGLL